MSIILQFKKNSGRINNTGKWLNGAIHNHFCLFLKEKKKNEAMILDNFIVESTLDEEHPETLITNSEALEAINQLEPPNNEVLRLRIVENLSHTEIAKKLNITTLNARTIYSRAIKKIKINFIKFVTLFHFCLPLLMKGLL